MTKCLALLLKDDIMVRHHMGPNRMHPDRTPCNKENPIKWLYVTPYKSTLNQRVEEVVVIAISECWTLSLCGSHTVLFGLSKQLNLNRKQGH